EDGPSTTPLFAVNGVYTDGRAPHLLHGPVWTGLRVPAGGRIHRLLDLRTGVLARAGAGGLRSVRFVSAARPHALALRAEAVASDFGPDDGTHTGDVQLVRTGAKDGDGIALAVHDDTLVGERHVVERLAAWSRGGCDDALAHLRDAQAAGFDQLLGEHREAWARRWADAEVVIEGNADDQLAARFAVFHLLSAAPDEGEAAVGPRGLTGDAYGGHVFWDADVFVLPALAALRPQEARAMLEYRIRRLPAARQGAAARGLRGARFPWESAGDGTDVTPRHVRNGKGQLVPIRTGQHEEHVTAGVAWAADRYAAWTGDAGFLGGPGRDLLVNTARYWASRIRCDK